MDNTISFTVNQLIGFVTTVGGCIVIIEAVVLIIFKLISKAKAPEVEQNKRIKALEEENKSRKEEIEELKKRIGGNLTAFFVQKEIRLPKIVYTSILMIYKL